MSSSGNSGAKPTSQSPSTGNVGSAFEEKFRKFWEQLNNGCGGECNYTFCASNRAQQAAIKKLTKNEKAALTMSLSAKAGKALYDQLASPLAALSRDEPYLDLPMLSRVIKECKDANTNVALVRLLGSVFRSSNALSMSFLASPFKASPTGEDMGLALDDVREAYRLIQELPENVWNSLHGAVESMAAELSRGSASLFHPHQLRQFAILLEYPSLSDPTSHRRLLGPLLIAFQNLPPSSSRFLVDNYFAKWSDERLREWNSTLQNMIALSALEFEDDGVDGSEWDPHRDQFVIAATVGIGIASTLNQERNFLGFQEFYSQFINDKLDVAEDFTRYFFPDRHPGFYYISCSYVLNPETKSNLLQIESSVNQQITVRERAFEQLLIHGEFAPYLVLRIHRERLIPTSLNALLVDHEDLKKQLKIKFVGEEGIDEGGVKKEWFQLLVKEIFDAKYGMFNTDKANRLQWFNPASEDFGEFELLGKVLGLAVYNAVILDLHFPSIVYKKLMGHVGTFENGDLAQINPELEKGLQQLLSYDETATGESVEELFGLNFRISYEVYGHIQTHDLVENGDTVPVTSKNRREYVQLYADFLLNKSIERQFERFKKGFSAVCDSKIFHLFRYEELELLICGSPVLDFDELEANTSYEGFEKDDVTIKNFWAVLHELSLEEQKRFLFFATGTDRAPIGGLARIGLVISKHGEENRLPASHTCFSVVLLAPTPDLEKMRKAIHIVIDNAEGFGMI